MTDDELETYSEIVAELIKDRQARHRQRRVVRWLFGLSVAAAIVALLATGHPIFAILFTWLVTLIYIVGHLPAKPTTIPEKKASNNE